VTFLLSLLGIGKNVMGWLTAGFKWIFAVWYRLAIAVLLAACLWLYVGKASETKRADKFKRTAEVEMSLRIANEVAYKDAQKVAADLNKKQVESIKSQYAAIAEKSEIDYEKRLADNRAALRQWMRAKAAPGIAQSTGASSTATVSGEPVQDPTEAVVPISDLEIAADNYSQLVSLIEWAKKVGEVKPNP
jgi:preprotein translocase subunit SecF